MKKIILTSLTILSVQLSFAQLSIAPELGFQMANSRVNPDSVKADLMNKAAFRAGINLGFGLTKRINIHAGVFYSGKGSKINMPGIKMTQNLNYIEIPIYLNYTILKFAGNQLFVGAGPYFAYTISAKTKNSSIVLAVPGDLSIGNKTTDTIKPLDYGANADLGFMTKFGLYARAHYSLGLSNTKPQNDNKNALKNTTFGISMGYQIKL